MRQMPNSGMTEKDYLNKRKEILTLKEEIAELEKDIATHQKDRLASILPQSETEPLKGSITVEDKTGLPAELLAFKNLMCQADEISERIQDLNTVNSLLIVDSVEISGKCAQYQQTNGQITNWSNQLDNLLDQANKFKDGSDFSLDRSTATAIPALIPGLVGSISDIVGYFRVNYGIKTRDVSVTDLSIRARIAGRLTNLGKTVYYGDFLCVDSSKIVTELNSCIETRNQLLVIVEIFKQRINPAIEIEIEEVESEIKGIEDNLMGKKDNNQKGQLNSKLAAERKRKQEKIDQQNEIKLLITSVESQIKLFDEFIVLITNIPEEATHSPLMNAIINDAYAELGISHRLYVTVTSAGSETITGQGMLRSGRISYLGGGVLTYILIDSAGKICLADTVGGINRLNYRLSQEDAPDLVWPD